MSTDYLHRESEKRFLNDVSGFQMVVAHDDGVYRHLRFSETDRSLGCYWFELVTWPGRLSIVGDMGSYTFSRLSDMFAFFAGTEYINPHYWGEKIIAHTRPLEDFSWDAFVQHVTGYYIDSVDWWADDDNDRNPAHLWWAIQAELLDEEQEDEQAANERAASFSFRGFEFADTWEWRSRDWSTHYLWCCHAIRWGIQQYRQAKAATA